MSPLAVKNGWTLAEAASDRTPDRMQRLLNAARWDADAVRDSLRGYITQHVGGPDGVLIVDETGHIRETRELLQQTGYTIQPGPHRLATLDDLYRLATAEGITPADIKAPC